MSADPTTARWRWPHWLHRQLDPASPAFAPGAGGWRNVTGRAWTAIGTPSGGVAARVDRCGLVWPTGATWTLDWWIGAEDRWHLPAEEATVRQRLVDGAPVVETSVRVPGGDARARVYAVAGGDGVDTVVVDVEADSAIPFALAWAVRPFTLEGWGRIDSVEIDGGVMAVDGRPAVWIDGHPGRVAVDGARDVAAAVMAGAAEEAGSGIRAARGDGRANAVVIVPVAHRSTTSLRLLPPSSEPPPRRRRRRPTAVLPVDSPGVDPVVSGWGSLVDRRVRLEFPDGPLADATGAQRRYLAVFAADVDQPAQGADELLIAAAQAGVDQGLTALMDRWFEPDPATVERDDGAASAALAALDGVVGLGAVTLEERWLPRVAERAERLARRHPDELRAVGLAAAATLLASAGEGEAAGRITGWLTPPDPVPAPPLTNGLVPVGDPPLGLSPAATLRAHPVGEVLDGVLDRAGPTWTWPEVLLPTTGAGTAGAGHDPAAVVAWWTAVRGLLVREDPSTGALDLATWWPPDWMGQPVEVHGLPTRLGTLSWAVRWHGHRPALLWELAGTGSPITLRAPGLHPTWSSTDRRGEALLDVGAPPSEGAAPGASFS